MKVVATNVLPGAWLRAVVKQSASFSLRGIIS